VATDVKLPRLGQGMEAGTIVKWLKAEGDRVEKGDPLFEVDTDKATQEVEAEAAGVLLKIAVEAGEVPVGQTIAVIGEEGERGDVSPPDAAPAGDAERADVSAPDMAGARHREGDSSDERAVQPREPGGAPLQAAPEGTRPVPGQGDESVTARPQENGGRVKASPLARRMASERGIELRGLRGTGPDGRIVAEDIERAEAGAAVPAGPAPAAPAPAAPAPAGPTPSAPAAAPTLPAQPEVESIPVTRVRATIARRLTAAWDVPAFQLTVSADMTLATELVERARELNAGLRVTVTDLLTKVCAMALQRHRDVNVQFTDEALVRFPTANVGIAVAAPSGLIVPVIRQAERLSLAEIAERRTDLVQRARDGKLQLQDLEGGTFTISNLGMFGVEQFVAVLNPPQAAILAVGATEERPVVREGELVARPMMTMTLTVDHRAVDGAEAADFLRTVKTFVEEPALAL
jgi:pyruvate dehydrogenase E2 component (dihydrolipoamide acetyltransferase)